MQCPKCMRHESIRAVLEKDKQTRKLWRITRCVDCGHNFDIEEVLPTRAPRTDPNDEDR